MYLTNDNQSHNLFGFNNDLSLENSWLGLKYSRLLPSQLFASVKKYRRSLAKLTTNLHFLSCTSISIALYSIHLSQWRPYTPQHVLRYEHVLARDYPPSKSRHSRSSSVAEQMQELPSRVRSQRWMSTRSPTLVDTKAVEGRLRTRCSNTLWLDLLVLSQLLAQSRRYKVRQPLARTLGSHCALMAGSSARFD